MKYTPTEVEIHPLIEKRWSPRAFVPRPVPPEDLYRLFEAARWAPSSYNEQPWAFLVAPRETEGFRKLLECLNEGNRRWAQNAGVLALSVARRRRLRDGVENRYAWHDVGLATGNLLLQATALGLYVHLMGGFDPERARALFAIPEDHDPVATMAIGYLAEPETLPEDLRQRERAGRSRRPVREFVFAERWGEPAPFLR